MNTKDCARIRKCILIVEDDQAIADMLSMMLDLEGYDVVVADSGLSAIRLLAFDRSSGSVAQGCEPDLMLLDLQLMNMDGVQLVEHMSELGMLVPPVIILSAKRPEAIEAAASSIGAVAAFTKPFDVADLLDYVRGALRAA